MNLISPSVRLLLGVAFSLAGLGTTHAQPRENAATLTVTVRDRDGVIPGAGVLVAPIGGGDPRHVATDDAGLATFRGLPAGTYDVRATFAGFEEAVEKALVLGNGETRALQLVLSLTRFSTAVTVTTANRREQLLLEVAEPKSNLHLVGKRRASGAGSPRTRQRSASSQPGTLRSPGGDDER